MEGISLEILTNVPIKRKWGSKWAGTSQTPSMSLSNPWLVKPTNGHCALIALLDLDAQKTSIEYGIAFPIQVCYVDWNQ